MDQTETNNVPPEVQLEEDSPQEVAQEGQSTRQEDLAEARNAVPGGGDGAGLDTRRRWAGAHRKEEEGQRAVHTIRICENDTRVSADNSELGTMSNLPRRRHYRRGV